MKTCSHAERDFLDVMQHQLAAMAQVRSSLCYMQDAMEIAASDGETIKVGVFFVRHKTAEHISAVLETIIGKPTVLVPDPRDPDPDTRRN